MISLLLPLALLQAAQQPPAPRRDVPDPGVIASMQRVTPAGVQSVFNGRVTGVRFGASANDLWVGVVGSAYHLAWADNRVLARGSFNGPTGVQAVAIDPVTGRALVTSIGHLPITSTEAQMPGTLPRLASRPAVQVSFFDESARGNGVAPVFTTGPLGEFLVGSPAVASKSNVSGHRIAVVPLTVEDRLTIIDVDKGTPLSIVPLGVAPIAAVLSADGAVAYVTNLGGDKPRPGERAVTPCCYPRGEPVRVDDRGIAERGSVMRVDVVAHKVTGSIAVGRHPTAIVWDTLRNRLYVADGNDDDVSVIDVSSNAVVAKFAMPPFRERGIGMTPTALALLPDGKQLLVALGGLNAVAVYDLSTDGNSGRFAGLIPTAWYPSSLDVSRDGRYLAIGALFGVGSGAGRTDGSPGKRSRYVFAERGSVSVVEIPGRTQLAAYTAAVASNDHLTFAGGRAHDSTRLAATPRAVPELPGDPSLIKHVVYVIKENRTYDQVLGDLGRGDGDSSLVIFGRDVTPNQHALAEQFVTLDRMFASGGNSADGHNWLTQAYETEYAMWPLYLGRSYPSEGIDPLAYSSGGFLWESAEAKGKTVTVFGEYAPSASDSIPSVRSALMAEYRSTQHGSAYFRDLLRKRYDTRSDIPSLDKVLVREYPGWTQEVPDVVKAEVILDHLRDWERSKTMPDLVMVVLPSDHTVGTSPEWCVPRACVADNDLALGKIVDGLTHSSFWKDMAILVVEDDAQNGVDHVDGHRTTAFAISPYVRRGSVDHTFYNQPSMVKTIELMLGLPALSLFDLVATDMRASFINPGEQPNYAPFSAVAPRQRLDEVNLRVSDIRGSDAATRRRAALASMRMRFDGPDEAPSDALNRILWHDVRGWRVAYPAVKQSLFFPMSRDIADDDREEKADRRR